jgi:alpha-galactosidase
MFRRESCGSALAVLVAFVLALGCAGRAGSALAEEPPPARTLDGLALTPPMGWNTYNRFGCNIDEALIRGAADAMVASGMRDAGYKYVVIDDCWEGARDADGRLQPDPKRFASGMKALGDYIHSKGLLFGIYSDAGVKTCAGRPASQGHEYQDAAQFAAWGVDYLKYDWCTTYTRDGQEAYTTMADAIRATGRPIMLSICDWGTNKAWVWGKTVGDLWRTTGDIYDHWSGTRTYERGMLNIVDLNEPLYPFAGPGHWNDPDMLEVGNGGMTDTEYRSHFSLWAMMAAPLIAGNDLAHMSEATKAILMNREAIAIDQDALGRQGRRVRTVGQTEVWSRPLVGGRRAVLLLNRGETAAQITADWLDLDYPATIKAKLRDVWAHRDLPTAKGAFTATVQPHGVVMVIVDPT